jgi:hypothetical protein
VSSAVLKGGAAQDAGSASQSIAQDLSMWGAYEILSGKVKVVNSIPIAFSVAAV